MSSEGTLGALSLSVDSKTLLSGRNLVQVLHVKENHPSLQAGHMKSTKQAHSLLVQRSLPVRSTW